MSEDKPQQHHEDGAAWFDGNSLHNLLYDPLYGSAMANSGDKAFMKALAADATDILDAACGTGRLFTSLARPGRRIEAFDASEILLQQAAVRAQKLEHLVPIGLSRQRLESFSYPAKFDLIVVAYYGFSCLLDPADRDSCLRRIAAHLKPGGLAVLHLPAPELLAREVPSNELAAMRSVRAIRQQNGLEFQLEHTVTAMEYDPVRARRSIHVELVLRDPAGNALHAERGALHYACISAPELERAALDCGLAVHDLRSGFKVGVKTELVTVLRGQGFPIRGLA